MLLSLAVMRLYIAWNIGLYYFAFDLLILTSDSFCQSNPVRKPI